MLKKVMLAACMLISFVANSQLDISYNQYRVTDAIENIVAKTQVARPYAPGTLSAVKGMPEPICVEPQEGCPDDYVPPPPTYFYRSIKNGDWNNLGVWEWSTDSVNWSAASVLPDKSAYTITIQNNDTINVTATVTIDETVVQPKAALAVASGVILNVINNGLSLQSNATGTASILNSAGNITGNVTVERYFPARRAWRLITSPVSNANTIRQAWQNNGVYQAGIGMFITGPGGVSGLDAGNSYSAKTYNVSTQQLENLTNTNIALSALTGSAANRGYFIFVRGDRAPINLTAPNTNATTISATGALQMGTQSFTAANVANQFTLIGNPYASPINFAATTRNNVAKRFYAWDPTLNTVGGYVTVDDVNNTGTFTINPASSQTSILQSGQAFFVQTIANGAASIVFEENNKSTVSNNVGFRPSNRRQALTTTLYLENADTSILADGVTTEFDPGFAREVDLQDAPKMVNVNENLAIERGDHQLSIERRPLFIGSDTVLLRLRNVSSRNYSFKFEPDNVASLVTASLEDAYLKTSTPLSMSVPTLVNFSVTANTAAANVDRFMIVFKGSNALPISDINVKAAGQNAGVQVEWKNLSEWNMQQYEVEKSADGQVFVKMDAQVAKANNNKVTAYQWFDTKPFASNFYRIKGFSKSGEVKYSETVNVKIGNGKNGIYAYPNPVTNRILQLQLNNQPKGKYLVELIDGAGRILQSKTIEHDGGAATHTIRLSSTLSKGSYQLHVVHEDKTTNQEIIVL